MRNSLQYTDAGGELRIGLSLASGRAEAVAAAASPSPSPTEGRGPDWLVIDFQDSAPGVPEEALGHLFERLYRVDASRARHSGGAGLGLAIARNIATAHGGDIAAHPSPLGGLWIRLRLPLEGPAP